MKRCVPVAASFRKASGDMTPPHQQPHRRGLAVELQRHQSALGPGLLDEKLSLPLRLGMKASGDRVAAINRPSAEKR